MTIYRTTQLVVTVAVLGVAAKLYAQSELPPPLDKLLSADAATAVLSVIGIVTTVKNLLPFVKGGWALVVTTVASIGVSLVKYGASGSALTWSLLIGVASAYVFFVTTNAGRLSANVATDQNKLAAFINAVKYIFARKSAPV